MGFNSAFKGLNLNEIGNVEGSDVGSGTTAIKTSTKEVLWEEVA